MSKFACLCWMIHSLTIYLTVFEKSFTREERFELIDFLFCGCLLEHQIPTNVSRYELRYIFHEARNSKRTLIPIEKYALENNFLGKTQ